MGNDSIFTNSRESTILSAAPTPTIISSAERTHQHHITIEDASPLPSSVSLRPSQYQRQESIPPSDLSSSSTTTPMKASSSIGELEAEEQRQRPINRWEIRYLVREDFEQVMAICRESFPLSYPEAWYLEVVTGKYISFGLFCGETMTSLLVAEMKALSECDQEVGILSFSSI